MLDKVRDGLARQVRVHDHRGGAVEQLLLRGEVVRRQLFADLHVGHGHGHVAVAVAHEHVGRGAAVGHAQRVRKVDAEFFTALFDLACARIAAHGGQKIRRYAEQAHVVRDVASHAAEAQLDLAGVRVLRAQRREGVRADVDIHAAADDGVGKILFVRHDVAFSELFVIKALGFILRLAADVNAEALVELDVLLRDDDGEVRIAAAERAELGSCHVGEGVRQR